MRKLLTSLTLLTLAACGPKTYLGPLDSPVGNWKEAVSKYYFNGENVYEAQSCTYSATSFYKDSLCCIQGVKGTFKWTYSGDSLVVDSTIWKVTDLSGRKMDLDYLGMIEKSVTNPDENVAAAGEETQEPQSPIEYKGKTIETDGQKHWYLNAEGRSVPCFPVNETAEDGSSTVVCWWDTRSDSYNPF